MQRDDFEDEEGFDKSGRWGWEGDGRGKEFRGERRVGRINKREETVLDRRIFFFAFLLMYNFFCFVFVFYAIH